MELHTVERVRYKSVTLRARTGKATIPIWRALGVYEAGVPDSLSAVLRAFLGYYFLVFMMRIAGRRPGKQLTPMEFILVFFCGGLTLTAIVADDRSFVNALSQIVAIALAHYSLVLIRARSKTLSRIVDGTPLVLLERGQWHHSTLISQSITDDDVMAMARDQGLKSLEDIEYAVLERNGEISIIPKESE